MALAGTIEQKLASVFAELERRADEDDLRTIEFARAAEERHRAELLRLERERFARREQARGGRLQAEVSAWRTAADIRTYVAALRERAASLDVDERNRLLRWCEWAEAWADQTDPVANPAVVTGLAEED